MLSDILDLTYYTPVICRSILKKNGSTYFTYSFTLPKRLLINNNIDKLLPYYKIGNWKTKEIFKAGKLTNLINNSLSITYNKYIPLETVNRLQINKHDILRIRLENDIVWIEKIDNITLKDINSLEHRFITDVVSRKNNFNNEHMELAIPISIIDRSLNRDIGFDVDLVIIDKKFISINLKLYKNSTSFHLYITKKIKEECKLETGKCLCSFKDKTFTIEKFLDQLGKKDEL